MTDFSVIFIENGHRYTLVVRAYLHEREEIRSIMRVQRPHAEIISIRSCEKKKEKKSRS